MIIRETIAHLKIQKIQGGKDLWQSFRQQHGKINDWNELLEILGFTPMPIDDLNKKHDQVSL